MEDEIDIYADLPNFNLEEDENLTEKNKRISERCTKLENQVTELTQSLESLKKINNNLEVNLSSLLKTAKVEIARKDRMIADIRRQLEDVQFRRGDCSKSVRPTCRSPTTKRHGNSPVARTQEVELKNKVPDITEFVCDNPPSINNTKLKNTVDKSHQLNGIVSTVFGERLRKRILDEQKEEQKQKEEARARLALDAKQIPESNMTNQIYESNSKTDSFKSDDKITSDVKTKNKQSSQGSDINSSHREDGNIFKRSYSDRKRQSEDRGDSASSNKKLKIDDGRGNYRDNNRHDDKSGDSLQNFTKSRSDDQSGTEILSNHHDEYRIVDEYVTPVEHDPENKKENIDDELEERHNRVAIRLMLLAEGIDPDLESKKLGDKDQAKIVNDKKQVRKKTEDHGRSRSKSRNRRHNYRSRSRTPDEHWKNRRRSRQRDNRSRRSRDTFERRRESKNKDGDNLSEFSREICELKERLEHRVDDRSSDRARKGTSLNRHKRNDDRFHKNERSRTPDSSKSGSKERTVHGSRDKIRSRRSWSRNRQRSRSRGQCYSNVDGISDEHYKTVTVITQKTKALEVKPVEVSSKTADNLDSKSLLSLEDGEIIDSATSSPVKTITENSPQTSITKPLPSDCEIISLNSEKYTSKVNANNSSLHFREIGNGENNKNPSLDDLNSSKDERIENIAKFIANFGTISSEHKNDEQFDDKMISNNNHHEKIESNVVPLVEEILGEKIPQTTTVVTRQHPLEDDYLSLLLTENSDAINTQNINGDNGDDHWCLIALDSPVKNFEENRKTRMMAHNIPITEKLESPLITSTDEPLQKDLVDKSSAELELDGAKHVFDRDAKPLIQSTKNTSKNKPVVLRSLRSSYHKGRKEIVLSDTSSEECKKIAMPEQIKSGNKSLSDEDGTKRQSGDDIDELVEFENIENCRSKSPVLINVDRNSDSSQKVEKMEREVNLIGDLNKSDDVATDKKTGTEHRLDVISSEIVHAETVTRLVELKENDTKPDNVTSTKIDENSMTEVCNSLANESRGNQTADGIENIGTKLKTVLRAEKTNENKESDIGKSLEIGNKPGKVSAKSKVDGGNNKLKKESKKLIVSARRRKPVHLEDSSTSLSIVTSENGSKNIMNNDIEALNSLDMNRESGMERGENEAQKKEEQKDLSS